MSNENLRKAKQAKNDEFYTQYSDIEAELIHYKDQLRGKIIYCNCDTPDSNFVKFLTDMKNEWGIREVWHTSLDEGISFDSPVAKELLAKCDIVITNPPFSITRERFVPMLEQSGKQFLFIGNLNMATMKEIFPLIRDNKLWTGYTHPKQFLQPDGSYKKFGNCLWWTNLKVDKELKLNPDKKYYGNEDKYPHYDNYDAINVDRLADIPSDYYGVIGVPVTFVEHYTPPMQQIGGHFGSASLDSEKAQTDAISMQREDTSMDDTLSVLDHSGSLRTSVGGGQNELTSSESSFSVIGTCESCGTGLSNGLHYNGTDGHTLIGGQDLYKNIYQVVDALNVPFIRKHSIFKRLIIRRIRHDI